MDHQDTDAPYDDTHQDTDEWQSQSADVVDTSDYTLTVEQVAALLHEAGYAVSPRTVSRWCEKGYFDCQLMPLENGRIEKYFVTEASVQKRIEQLARVKPTQSAPRHDEPMARHDTSRHANGTPRRDDDEVETLRDENLQLKIDKAARDQVIKQLTDERAGFFDDIRNQAYRIGQLETRLDQIEAPRARPTIESVEPVDNAPEAPPEGV